MHSHQLFSNSPKSRIPKFPTDESSTPSNSLLVYNSLHLIESTLSPLHNNNLCALSCRRFVAADFLEAARRSSSHTSSRAIPSERRVENPWPVTRTLANTLFVSPGEAVCCGGVSACAISANGPKERWDSAVLKLWHVLGLFWWFRAC